MREGGYLTEDKGMGGLEGTREEVEAAVMKMGFREWFSN